MDFNLFNWIREGVRRSVMLGVADAIETVGSPQSSEELQKSLQGFRSRIDAPMERNIVAGNLPQGTTATGTRKRLGRTLKDIETT